MDLCWPSPDRAQNYKVSGASDGDLVYSIDQVDGVSLKFALHQAMFGQIRSRYRCRLKAHRSFPRFWSQNSRRLHRSDFANSTRAMQPLSPSDRAAVITNGHFRTLGDVVCEICRPRWAVELLDLRGIPVLAKISSSRSLSDKRIADITAWVLALLFVPIWALVPIRALVPVWPGGVRAECPRWQKPDHGGRCHGHRSAPRRKALYHW